MNGSLWNANTNTKGETKRRTHQNLANCTAMRFCSLVPGDDRPSGGLKLDSALFPSLFQNRMRKKKFYRFSINKNGFQQFSTSQRSQDLITEKAWAEKTPGFFWWTFLFWIDSVAQWIQSVRWKNGRRSFFVPLKFNLATFSWKPQGEIEINWISSLEIHFFGGLELFCFSSTFLAGLFSILQHFFNWMVQLNSVWLWGIAREENGRASRKLNWNHFHALFRALSWHFPFRTRNIHRKTEQNRKFNL